MSRWKPQKERTLLSTHQAAEILQIHPSSLIKWINDGLLDAQRTPGGHRRIRAKDLVQFLQKHDMEVPSELLGDRRRVLWVDDDPAFLQAVDTALKRAETRIDSVTCDNGIDALVQVGAFKPHLIVLDVFMPGIDGFEVCRRLKAGGETSHIGVIMVSGAADEELAERAKAVGARELLEKPLDITMVLEALQVAEDN